VGAEVGAGATGLGGTRTGVGTDAVSMKRSSRS